MPTYSTSPFVTDLQSTLVVADDIDEDGITDATGRAGAFFVVHIINGSDDAYLNIYDNGNPTLGTTEPDWIFPVQENNTYVVYIDSGVAFGSALSLIGNQSAGGSAGAAPTNLDVRVMVSDTVRA